MSLLLNIQIQNANFITTLEESINSKDSIDTKK
jgi:hypothetical protein